MKLYSRSFMILERAMIALMVFLLVFLKIDYDSFQEKIEKKTVIYQKMRADKELKLQGLENTVYQRIFQSQISAHDLIPSLQKSFEEISKKHNVILSDIKIKKQEDNILSSFVFSIKIKSHDDRFIYHFLEEVEKIQGVFVISKSLNLKKIDKDPKMKVEGNYAFEVYTKS